MTRDLYTRVFSNALFPLHERLKGHRSVTVRKWLEDTQWWSADALERLQLERLQRLLEHAGTHVPYYRRLFSNSGFEPSAVRSLADLQALPFLDKRTIRAQAEALKSETANDLVPMTTGGSSGEPLRFWLGKERVSHDVAAKWRATRWWGVDMGDPEIVLWGSPIELGKQDYLKLFRDRLQRSVLLPAFEMSDAKLRDFIETIKRRRPRMMFGYPSALAHVGRFAQREGVRLDNIGCRVAFVTGERLYPEQESVIQDAFGCPVANGYGGRDAGFIAHECPSKGMHITAEDVIVEVIDERGQAVPPGESGELVITHLATRDFPFIRYRTGDVAAIDASACGCGRSLPRITNLQGRVTDFVVAEDGTVMHGLALIYVVRDTPGVENFRILQSGVQNVRLQLVTGSAFDESAEEALRNGFRARLGNGVAVTIERVAEIPADRSGKFRYVVSDVAPDAMTGGQA